MSENLDDRRFSSHFVTMDLDHDACYRAVCQRDPRFDGRFFTGVKTTGIYCRPICPARTAEIGECDVLSHRCCRPGSGFPAMSALPA